MKSFVTLWITVICFTAATSFCLAAEKTNHVCFRVVDADRDGVVTYPEFEKIYGSDTETFESADSDKDGRLTHEEYHRMLGHGSP